jgi:uncharacterized protein
VAANDRPRYRSYTGYLKDLYGKTTYRVGIDAGFSCPHRGSDSRAGGCAFCDEHGSRAAYQRGVDGMRPGLSLDQRLRLVKGQVEHGLEFLGRRYKTDSFILYFQAFSSTYARVDELKAIYDAALSVHPFRELIISTRPDCVDDETAELLGGYVRAGLPVWVELGLQSASDVTLERINRGHSVLCFERALNVLREKGILVAAHVIFGLPGEGYGEIMHTVDYLAARKIDGIKIHDLHIPRSSSLFSEYLVGEYALPCEERHLEYVVDALERLPEKTVIMRLTCDTPHSARGLPLRPAAKEPFVRHVREELERRASRQGMKT